MSLILSGSDGLSDVDGSASTPAIRGTDANTGIFFPAADTIAFAEGGAEAMRIDSSGNVGIGTTSPANILTVQTAATGTTAGSNVIARLQANGLGRDATLQLSDNVANSATISMVAGAMAFRQNGVDGMRLDVSSNFQFNSGYGSVATAYGCRVWVNFNGTGTVAIRASGNVTSITDNGTGDYTVNFTTAMPDANYGIAFSGDVNTGVSANDVRAVNFGASAAGSLRIYTGNNYTSPVGEDWALICLSIFR